MSKAPRKDRSDIQEFTVSGSRETGYILRADGRTGDLAYSTHQIDVIKKGVEEARKVKGILKIKRSGSDVVRDIRNYSGREKLRS